MWQPIPNHQLSEVLIGREENAPFAERNRQDFSILQRAGVVDGDGLNVVTLISQEDAEASVNILIQQKSGH